MAERIEGACSPMPAVNTNPSSPPKALIGVAAWSSMPLPSGRFDGRISHANSVIH
jgi:hypothetical protein